MYRSKRFERLLKELGMSRKDLQGGKTGDSESPSKKRKLDKDNDDDENECVPNQTLDGF